MCDETKELAESLLQNAFDINYFAWMEASFDTRLIEYHFFTMIYEISLSEAELNNHPEARGYLEIFPHEFIKIKLKEATYDLEYALRRSAFNELFRKQPKEDQTNILRNAIYRMYVVLMTRDFGAFFDAFDSECNGITKEAEDFISNAHK